MTTRKVRATGCGHPVSTREPFCRARATPAQPSAAAALRLGLFPEKTISPVCDAALPWRRKASRFPVSGCPSLPLSFQTVTLEHASQIIHIEFSLLAKNTHAFAVLVSAGLQTDGDQMFRAHDSGGYLLIQCFSRLSQRLFQQGVISGKKLHRHTLDEDALSFLDITSRARLPVERGQRKQIAGILRKDNEHV